MRYVYSMVLCVLFCFSPVMALAGSLDDPGGAYKLFKRRELNIDY